MSLLQRFLSGVLLELDVLGIQLIIGLDIIAGALGLGLALVFILLTQSCIDRAKDLLHLLKGVTAHSNRSIGADTRPKIV